MTGVTDQQIERIQASGCRAAIVVSGGGIGAVHALLLHPGASRFVLEVQIPYSPQAMFDYLGEEIGRYCSAEAAATMAERAYERAVVCRLADHETFPVAGIACTAALATNRERRGRDRAYLCIKSRHEEAVRALELTPAGRAEQDEQVSSALLQLIEEFTGRPSE
jgi:hypothetical protein